MRLDSITNLLLRNPNAYIPKIIQDNQKIKKHSKGCQCVRSGCVKKYCECYQAGIKCDKAMCKCTGCGNCNEDKTVKKTKRH